MKKIYILIFFLITDGFSNISYGLENKIIFKVNDKIITSFDIKKETNYLFALSPNINNLDSSKVYQISKNSILKEKIKKIELLKNFESIEIEKKILDNFIENTYKKLGINSKDEFKDYLKNKDLTLKDIEKKISVEIAWNRLVYLKFSKNVKINKDELKKKILRNKKEKFKIYLLQEILFQIENNTEKEKKIFEIKKTIKEKGFEEAALLYSVTDSAKDGGTIGWVNENSLNLKILKKVESIKLGYYTEPIVIPGGFLILKVKDIKENSKDINIEDELKKIIRIKTNEQLNQFSLIFYNKLMKNTKIDEL